MGGATSDIITQARDGLSQIATGSYVGNGGTTAPTQIAVPFQPKILFIVVKKKLDESCNTYTYINDEEKPWSNIYYTYSAFWTSGEVYRPYNFIIGDTPRLVREQATINVGYRVLLSVNYENGICYLSQTAYGYKSSSVYTYSYSADAQYQFNTNNQIYQYVFMG